MGFHLIPPLALFPHSCILFSLMAEKLDPNEIITPGELVISSMWETASLVEVLEKKGLLTKQDILDAIQELRQVKMAAKGFRGFPKWAGGREWVRCG